MGAPEAIAEAIRGRGPLRFDVFMELALYGEGGYYHEPPVGPGGDFVTSPHVHPIFGELLAAAIRELAALLGSPSPLRIAEVGAGDGTLAGQVLAHLGDLDVSYAAVERGRGALTALGGVPGIEPAERLHGAHVVIANELLDNLPFRRIRGTPDGPREVAIDLDDEGRFVERLLGPAEPAGPVDDLETGREVLVPTGAVAFVGEVAARLARPGYALLIDYGAAGEPGGPVHGYRNHRVVEDLLAAPGSTDITAGVDLDLIARAAEAAGLVAHPTVSQRHALVALGFDRWVRDELERQTRLLREGAGAEAVRAWSGRSRATLLVDPTALGRLRWLLLATPGAPSPSWT